MKDTFDDAIKAAESAYNNGVVLGCNITLISALNDIMENLPDKEDQRLRAILLDILGRAFCKVYRTVLENAIPDIDMNQFGDRSETELEAFEDALCAAGYKHFSHKNIEKRLQERSIQITNLRSIGLLESIIMLSILSDSVFNLSVGDFDRNVINSAETDKEILKATIDLLSLLITGNQLVLR